MNTTLRMKITFRSAAKAAAKPRAVVAPLPRPAGGSTDAREFLAMAARQRRAAARARRLKRAVWVVGLAAAAGGFFVWNGRSGGRGQPQAVAAVSAPAAAPTAAVAALVPAAEAAPELAMQSATAPAEPAAEITTVTVAEAPSAGCDVDFSERRWRAALESCGRAYAAAPSADLALRLAHAHWARDQFSDARALARRALELGSTDADAYVLIGNSERRAGNLKDARTAYRRYLRAAPEGWHARPVRAALRELRRELEPSPLEPAPISIAAP